MTIVQTQKLVIIGFHHQGSHLVVSTFEALYLCAVMKQLARLEEVTFRSLAFQEERISVDISAEGGMDDRMAALSKLRQICRAMQSRYLLTGMIYPVSVGERRRSGEAKAVIRLEALHVVTRLYDDETGAFCVDDTDELKLNARDFGPGDGMEKFPLPIEEFNQLVNRNVMAIAKQWGSQWNATQLPILTRSYVALQAAYQGDLAKAGEDKIQAYEAALKMDASLEPVYYELAHWYKNAHLYEQSVACYRKGLEKSESTPRLRAIHATEAGIVCALMQRTDLAVEWWERAIAYDDAYLNPYFNIANVYEDEENYTQAELYFKKAQTLAPTDFRTFFNLARVYAKMGAWEKALGQYKGQLQSEGNDPWCHSDVAMCYLNLGDIANAKRHLEQALTLDPAGEAGQYAELILSGLG